MKSLGIDLSSQAAGTACCTIQWEKDRATVEEPVTRCNDARLDELVAASGVIGIDAPLGWPAPFRDAVADWQFSEWTNTLRDELRFRETDRVTKQLLGKTPLSVSTDLISLPAMRAMALLHRLGVEDKSGGAKGVYEVYPAGSLRVWDIYLDGYKKSKTVRIEILIAIRSRLPWLDVSDEYAKTDHCLDSLVASLSAHSAATGNSTSPTPPQKKLAQSEGWIHLPLSWPTL